MYPSWRQAARGRFPPARRNAPGRARPAPRGVLPAAAWSSPWGAPSRPVRALSASPSAPTASLAVTAKRRPGPLLAHGARYELRHLAGGAVRASSARRQERIRPRRQTTGAGIFMGLAFRIPTAACLLGGAIADGSRGRAASGRLQNLLTSIRAPGATASPPTWLRPARRLLYVSQGQLSRGHLNTAQSELVSRSPTALVLRKRKPAANAQTASVSIRRCHQPALTLSVESHR